ncbi:hypothetical protein [Ohtaekwangia sp.]|uniref:hypothetical protein n=1 Tax=Ohtaekwangia sp. TaxID=2066019 RepID=UPI002F92E75A
MFFLSKRLQIIRSVYILAMVYLITSCGNRAKELAQQKMREDSIRIATEHAVRMRLDKIQSLEDSLADIESEQEGLDNRLMIFKADLEAAKDKLATIKQYQLLRTADEREQQVRDQGIIIEKLEREVESILDRIDANEEAVKNIRLELSKIK